MDEVGRRQDPDRDRLVIVGDDDQAVDVIALHPRRGDRQGRRARDRDRRGGHQVTDREAGPVGPEVLGRPRPDEVGLADDADERAGGVDDGQAADAVVVHELGRLLQRRIGTRRR